MLILGMTGGVYPLVDAALLPDTGWHDSAAVLLENTEVLAGIEEERLNRIKHTNKPCSSAVRFCLETAQKTPGGLDAIAIYSSEDFLNAKLKSLSLLGYRKNAA